jgi:hypothetical protein
MKFDSAAWLSEFVTAALTGAMGGFVGALFVPNPPLLAATLGGAVTGAVVGLVNMPLKVLMDRILSGGRKGDNDEQGK